VRKNNFREESEQLLEAITSMMSGEYGTLVAEVGIKLRAMYQEGRLDERSHNRKHEELIVQIAERIVKDRTELERAALVKEKDDE